MRAVHLNEGSVIFKSVANETLSKHYECNKSQFKVMVTEQGEGYWMKFCITLKQILVKEGYGIRYSIYFQNFFIELTERLTCSVSRPEVVELYVTDVLNILTSSRIFRGTNVYSEKSKYFDVNSVIASIRRLFGIDCPNRFIKIWATLPLYRRAVGSILRIFKLWNSAKVTSMIKWNIPDSWLSSKCRLPGKYEIHLEKKWGKNIFSLLDISNHNITWWNTTSKLNDIILVKKQSKLACGIIKIVQDSAVLLQEQLEQDTSLSELGKLANFHLRHNFPRGSKMIIFSEERSALFSVALSRELYLSSSHEVFHPYSQFSCEFLNKSFGPQFWKSLNVADKHDNNIEENKSSCPTTMASLIRTAIYLDSSFYDSLANERDWTSTDVLICLIWDMPLCLNWLEVLLLYIYKFEFYFLPFIHYPLKKYVKELAEQLYARYCSRARFLVRAAIIVAEYIFMNENDFHTRCYDARITLKFAVSMCIPIFNFYNGPIYQVLDVILRESYPDGENSYLRNAELSNTDYVYVNNYCQCTAPNVDQCFNSDRRSISYWLNRKEKIQKLEECWKYFPDALKALQDYEKHVSQHDNLKCKCDEWSYIPYTYDKKIYMDAFTGAFDVEMPVTVESEVSFINDVVDLLKDDELLEEDFQPKFTSIDINCQGTDEEKQAIYDLAHLGRVYVVCSTLYGNTYSDDIVSVPDQILLTKILNTECCSAMVDAACSFVLKAKNYSSLQSKLIPPPLNILRAAKREISAHELKPLTVSEAVYLVSSAQQYHVIDSTCLPDLQIPSIKSGSNCTMEDYRNFLCKLKGVRCRILYEVSEQQFRNTQINTPKNDSFIHITFPYFELLEYRFMEEIAALEKCLKFGDDYKLQASRLSLSLSTGV